MGKQHIIELNGKRYDALTGKMVTDSQQPIAAKTKSARPKSVDGFAKPARPIARTQNTVTSHQTEKSKTLMRKTVHKPAKPVVAKPAQSSQQIKTTSSVSPSRLAHAQSVAKSTLIRKFSDGVASAGQHRKLTASKPAASLLAAKAITGISDPIRDGLARADSHEQPKLKRVKRTARIARKLHISPRLLSGGALAIAGLVIAGFFTYQNIPNLSMRLASTRSGVHGTLPAYQPAGFSLSGGVSYKAGQITVGYHSNSDDRNFKIIQAASSWDSESLHQNYAALREAITVQDRGKTVYLYDGSNATWVDGGVWYRIEGNSQLNSDQLLNLAASL